MAILVGSALESNRAWWRVAAMPRTALVSRRPTMRDLYFKGVIMNNGPVITEKERETVVLVIKDVMEGMGGTTDVLNMLDDFFEYSIEEMGIRHSPKRLECVMSMMRAGIKNATIGIDGFMPEWLDEALKELGCDSDHTEDT